MNVFKAHGNGMEEQAKEMLVATTKLNLAKYITQQDKVNKMLLNFNPSKEVKRLKNKDKKCVLCRATAAFKKMTIAQGVVSECKKTFQILFGEELDVDELVKEVGRDLYPDADVVNMADNSNYPKEAGFATVGDRIVVPEDAPDSVKKMCEALQKVLNKNGMKGAQIEVVEMGKESFGLKQEDFPNFGEYLKAVAEKRREWIEENKNKAPEAVINDAIIHAAEAAPVEEIKKEKLN